MKKATTSDRLQELMKNRGLRQVDILDMVKPYCKKFDVRLGKNDLSQYVNGKVEPRQEKLTVLGQALGVSEAWLMGYDVPMERSDASAAIPKGFIPVPKTTKIPLVGTIACGVPILADENIEGYVELPDNIRADFALRCKGDSMIGAGIRDGDIVYIRKNREIPRNGQIAAIRINEEATLKRFYLQGDTVRLVAENPAVPTMIFVGEEINNLAVEGLAVGYTHKIVY